MMLLKKLNQKLLITKSRLCGSITKNKKGMTLIEIIIVVAILASIMAVLVTNVTQKAEQANIDQTKILQGQIQEALQYYRVHNFKYPTNLIDLVEKPAGAKRWRGPYMEKDKLKDTWDQPFEYESDGRNFKIISGGPGGEIGDDDDLIYPEPEEAESEG